MDLSPGSMQALALRDFDALLTGLRNSPNTLSSLLDRLVHRHETEFRADPSQLLPQLLARLPEKPITRAWKAEAAVFQRSASLSLQSRTLDGPERPLLWQKKPHSNLVHAIEVMPDGDTVVSAGEDGRLLRWSLSRKDQPPVELGGHRGPVNHLAVSANGRWLASAGDDGMVGLWDTQKLSNPQMLAGHKHYVRQVAFGGDRLFSVSQDKTAIVWSLPNGDPVKTIKHPQDVMSLAVSSDGEWLLTSLINSALLLWQVDSKKKPVWLYGNREKVMRVMGDVYLSGTNRSDKGHKEYPHRMEFLDNTNVWSMGREWILWDLYKKPVEYLRQPPILRSNAEAAVWIDRDRIAVGSYGIHLLKLKADGEWLPSGNAVTQGVLGPGTDRCTSLCLSTDGRTLLSGHSNGEIMAWDLGVDMSRLPESHHGGALHEMRESPSGRYLATKGNDDSVCVWDLEEAVVVDKLTLQEPNSYGDWCSFSAEEDLFAVGEGKANIHLRKLPEGGEYAQIRIPSEKNYQAISGLAFDLEGGYLHAGIGSGGLYRVNLLDPSQTRRYEGFSDSPSALWQVSPNLLLTRDNFSPSEDHNDWKSKVYQLLAWDPETCERLWKVSGVKKADDYLGPSLGDPVLLPEGLLSLTATDPQLLVLRDPATGEAIRSYDLRIQYFYAHRTLQDGSWFMMMQAEPKGRSRPTILDGSSGKILWQRDDPDGWRTTDLSPNGRIGVRLKEQWVEIYDPPSGEAVGRFFADIHFLCARFVLNGKKLVVGDREGRLHFFELSEQWWG